MKKILNISLLIIWMIFIFVMSSFSATESTNQSNIIVTIISSTINISNPHLLTVTIRKLAHLIEYLILGILSYNVFKKSNKNIHISTLVCFLYAISDEIHQIFIPGRSGQITDILIDTIGALIGIIIISNVNKNSNKNLQKH